MNGDERYALLERLHASGFAPEPPSEAVRGWSRDDIVTAIRDWFGQYGEPPSSLEWDPGTARMRGQHERAERAAPLIRARVIPHRMTVIKVFGRWNSAVEAAGFLPRPAFATSESDRRRRDRGADHHPRGEEIA